MRATQRRADREAEKGVSLRRRRRRRSTVRLGGARTRASAARGPLPSSPVRPGPPRPWAAPRLPRAPPTPPAAARPPAPRSRAAACRPMPRRRATPTSSSLGQIPGRNRCGSSIALSSPRWRWPRSGRGSKAVPTLSTCRLPGRALRLLLCPRTRGVAVDEVLASGRATRHMGRRGTGRAIPARSHARKMKSIAKSGVWERCGAAH
jgi:hypothetical protein